MSAAELLFTSSDVHAILSEATRSIKRGEPCPSIYEICRSLEGSGWRPSRMPDGLPGLFGTQAEADRLASGSER